MRKTGVNDRRTLSPPGEDAHKRQCPNCGVAFVDSRPRKEKICGGCAHVMAPRRYPKKAIDKRGEGVGKVSTCICCLMRGSRTIEVEDESFTMCQLCLTFAKGFAYSVAEMRRYIQSGGATIWIMAGKRLLLDDRKVGTVDDLRSSPMELTSMKMYQGAYQGGTPFGYKKTDSGIERDDDHRFTLDLIHTYLSRKTPLAVIARELRRLGRPNKHGAVSWFASTVKFLARREGWV